MAERAFKCPQCNGPLAPSRFARAVTCSYCGATVQIDEASVSTAAFRDAHRAWNAPDTQGFSSWSTIGDGHWAIGALVAHGESSDVYRARRARRREPRVSARALCLTLWFCCAATAAAGTSYVVDAGKSSVRVHVGKSGLFSFAGHEHEVRAMHLQGEIVADAQDLGASRLELRFEAQGLQVSEKDEPEGDAPKVQEAMLSPKVLDASRYPLVTFKSTSVTGKRGAAGSYELQVTGELALHGATKSLTVPVHVELAGNMLKATGRVAFKQSAYGMTPVSVAGVVKVKDELTVEFTIVASAAP